MGAKIAVIFDAVTLEPRMIVSPDRNSQLRFDPAFNPVGCGRHIVRCDIPKAERTVDRLYAFAKSNFPNLKWTV